MDDHEIPPLVPVLQRLYKETHSNPWAFAHLAIIIDLSSRQVGDEEIMHHKDKHAQKYQITIPKILQSFHRRAWKSRQWCYSLQGSRNGHEEYIHCRHVFICTLSRQLDYKYLLPPDDPATKKVLWLEQWVNLINVSGWRWEVVEDGRPIVEYR